MIQRIKTILFTSNLSENSRHAFNYAAMLTTEFNAKIVLLHVVEKMPDTVESRMRGLFGDVRWQGILESHMKDAHQMLVGKVTSKQMIRAALSQFCDEAGIDAGECGYVEREIVIKSGEVVEEILEQSKLQNCDMVVMGASKGFLSGTSIGPIIKSVMKRSKIPVMVIPPPEVSK
ncbi:MAG: universal stress protein [Desulfobacterales bacterium]